MILTESEAKTKWCPEVRTGLVHGMSVNHHIDMRPGGEGVHDETRCIASGCMFWRWHLHPTGAVDRTKGGDYSKGFCGKAGG